MEIVAFEPRHAPAWKRLNAAWIERFFVLEAKDLAQLDDPQGQVLEKGGLILMAERDGAAIGCCALIPMKDGGFELAKMTVDEAARGLGVGRRLIEACVDHGRSVGAPRLYLETNSALAPAIALYLASGFIHLPAQPTPYARCDVWMERRLA